MRSLEVTFDQPEWMRHPMQQFLASTDDVRREELVAWQLHDTERLEYALFFVHGDVDAYRDAIDEVESIRDWELAVVDRGRFYAYVEQRTREADRAWRQAFAERNLVVTHPIVYDERARMRMTIVGRADDLRAMLEETPESIRKTVHHVGSLDRRLGGVGTDLTGRQREALRTAMAAGYYEVPREGSLAEVAAALDVSEATASAHLRKAERTLVGRALGDG
ncbi:helix-turn-helix domain-containing protein [Halorarum halobium]|uniref:helix-turn-helix domain-containing protein n=1 Tax=Halorarum halobium TaxID=3075121 RepID=UPI0028AD4358|nr:helix-turn-helix domain-containing protein [Halobaculum sp. XH14]